MQCNLNSVNSGNSGSSGNSVDNVDRVWRGATSISDGIFSSDGHVVKCRLIQSIV